MNLQRVWKQIENKEKCSECSLKHLKDNPLVIKPSELEKVRIMTITEGPNRREDIRVLTSIANQPTFSFLFTLFNGEFRPCGLTASVYWTHVRKCFINGNIKMEERH